MSELNDFPAEISSQILGNLHIDDIFRARLVSRSFRAFVDQHIDLVAYQIARQDFPHARLLLDQPPGSKYDLPWLRTLIPRRLAAIVLDKHRIHRQHSASSYVLHIPAEDDYGDEPRARLTRAWCLLKRINDIHHLAAQPATRERPDYQPLDLPTVHARALELVKSLTPDQCKNFALLAYLVLSAFVDADIDAGDWRRHLTFTVAGQDEPVRFLDCAPRLQAVNESRGHFGFARAPAEGARKTVAVNSRHPDRGNSWVCAFLLREGADAFHRQWIVGAGGENYGNESKEREYVADRLIEQWGLRTPKEIHKERECASRSKFPIPSSAIDGSLLRPENSEERGKGEVQKIQADILLLPSMVCLHCARALQRGTGVPAGPAPELELVVQPIERLRVPDYRPVVAGKAEGEAAPAKSYPVRVVHLAARAHGERRYKEQ
ncbi:hypothetical protein F4810DRAFT_154087 [Camillea tinctor]|nr:hypothetical protein F4810DRAFT_154087 [Camillea tinctor]